MLEISDRLNALHGIGKNEVQLTQLSGTDNDNDALDALLEEAEAAAPPAGNEGAAAPEESPAAQPTPKTPAPTPTAAPEASATPAPSEAPASPEPSEAPAAPEESPEPGAAEQIADNGAEALSVCLIYNTDATLTAEGAQQIVTTADRKAVLLPAMTGAEVKAYVAKNAARPVAQYRVLPL